jgi:hypothetical protein
MDSQIVDSILKILKSPEDILIESGSNDNKISDNMTVRFSDIWPTVIYI